MWYEFEKYSPLFFLGPNEILQEEFTHTKIQCDEYKECQTMNTYKNLKEYRSPQHGVHFHWLEEKKKTFHWPKVT